MPKEKLNNIFYFFLFIPILNVISSIATPFFSGSLNPGVLRGIILTLFLVWFLINQYKSHQDTNLMMGYTIYIFILCWFSDEPSTSFYIFNKFAISSLMFIVGFHYISSPLKFLYLQRAFLISVVSIIIYFAFSNVVGVGKQSYQDDSVFFGESGVNITKSIAIFIIGIPLYLRIEPKKRYKNIALIALLIGVITVLIGMKRSAILAMGFGFFFYTLFTPYKTRIIKSIPVILLLLFISSPYYFPIIEKRFEARQNRVSMTVDQLQDNESEGRLLEIKFTIDQTFVSLERVIFGYNVFLKKDFLGRQRMLHVDYSNMLGGAGLIGLVLFIGVYIKIIRRQLFYKNVLGDNQLSKEIFATAVSLVAVQAFLSIGGTMQGVNQRGYILLYLGALLGLSLSLIKQKFIQKRATNQIQ
jgi:hypothetical protein